MISFEDRLERLEQIVQTIEKGELSLEESLKLFQEGTSIAAQCGKLLDEAELKVTKVLADRQGQPVEEAFSDGEI